jgi:hypothetical protein
MNELPIDILMDILVFSDLEGANEKLRLLDLYALETDDKRFVVIRDAYTHRLVRSFEINGLVSATTPSGSEVEVIVWDEVEETAEDSKESPERFRRDAIVSMKDGKVKRLRNVTYYDLAYNSYTGFFIQTRTLGATRDNSYYFTAEAVESIEIVETDTNE